VIAVLVFVAAVVACTAALCGHQGQPFPPARWWRTVRGALGSRKGLSARLEPEQPKSVPRDLEAAQRPSEALWALDPHDTGETPKPSLAA
jgi:hypothetical protein